MRGGESARESLIRVLFPDEPRALPGQRWIRIGLRTLHLIGVAGLGGAYLYEAAPHSWLPYFWLTMATGLLMVMLEVWSNAIWLLQIRGLAIVFKVLLLVAIALHDVAALPLILMVIAISGVIAHAPGNLRYYSPYHRRRLERLSDAR